MYQAYKKKYYLRSQAQNLIKNFESFAAVSNNPTENHSNVLNSNQTSLYNIHASNQDLQQNLQTDISLRNINTVNSNQNSLQNINTTGSNQNSLHNIHDSNTEIIKPENYQNSITEIIKPKC